MTKKRAPADPPNLTINYVAEHFNVTTRTVQNMIADGRLKAYHLGPRIVRLRLSEVEAALTPTDVA